MRKFFLFFLFLILLIPISIGINDWHNYRYDTLMDNTPETTFSRFDLGINVFKSLSVGNTDFQPMVVNTNLLNVGNTTSYTFTIASDNILRVYDKNFNVITTAIGHTQTGEMYANTLINNTNIDLIFLEKNGALATSNFSWYQFDGTTIKYIYSENFGITISTGIKSSGVMCNDNKGINYCVFAPRMTGNQTNFYRVIIDDTPTLDNLVVATGTATEINDETKGIPALRDYDYDGNLEAVYMSDIQGDHHAELISVDVTNLQLKSTFNSGGIVSMTDYGVLEPVLINVDGSEESLFEIIVADGLSVVSVYSASGALICSRDIGVTTITGIARTDFNNDFKYDIAVIDANGIMKVINGRTCAYIKETELPLGKSNCGGGVFGLVMTDLDNTGTGTTVKGIVTSCQIVILNGDMNFNQSLFNQSGFTTSTKTNPVVADINYDNLYEIIYSKDDNTTIYSATYINSPAIFLSYEINTGTPVCPEETVTFTCNGYDNDNEMINCGIDVYGNGSIEWGSFTGYSNYSITQHTFLNSEIGYVFNNMKIYMSDGGHAYNTEIFFDIPITYQVEDSVACHHAGEGGFEETINETGGIIDGEPVTDFSDFIDDILTLVGMNSAIGKGIIVLLILIMSIVGLSQIGNVPSEAYIIILITELGLFAWLEFLPIWLIILMIICASAFIVWLFRQPTGVAK